MRTDQTRSSVRSGGPSAYRGQLAHLLHTVVLAAAILLIFVQAGESSVLDEPYVISVEFLPGGDIAVERAGEPVMIIVK